MEEVISIESLEKTAKNLEKRVTHQSMVRVPSRLRQAHPDAYTPRFVCVGPFHYIGPNFNHTKDVNLLTMEGQKRAYMLRLLERTVCREETLQSCWKFLREETPHRIRNCYSEDIGIPSDNELLAKIMLVDGCFLLEALLCSYEGPCYAIIEDGSGLMTPMILGLRRDLALLENQIPFFVLQGLFDIISPRLSKTPVGSQHGSLGLTQMALNFFRLPSLGRELPPRSYRHLLDLISQSHHPANYLGFLDRGLDQAEKFKLPLARGVILCNSTKLKNAGVTFRRARTSCILDLRFSRGVLEIPPLVINDCTESLLRNLLAFEHTSKDGREYFVSYVIFMDHLIGSKEDLHLLESRGIIANELGGREDATKMFHNISKQFVLKNFYFRHLCQEIEKFCRSPRQRYIQELKQTYLNSPWTAISLIAAMVLLILTTIQTIYTVLSYYHQSY